MLTLGLLVLPGPREARGASACQSARFNDWKDFGCCQLPLTPKKVECPDCEGMARWWVSEPYISLQIADEPLSYYTSSGQKMMFRWTYQQRERLPDAQRGHEYQCDPIQTRLRASTVGWGNYCPGSADVSTNAVWCHNWWSEIVFWDTTYDSHPATQVSVDNPSNPTRAFVSLTANYEAVVFLGEGGVLDFTGALASQAQGPQKVHLEVIGGVAPQVPMHQNGVPDAYPTSGTVWVSNPANYGFRLVYPDGSKDVYGLVVVPWGSVLVCSPQGYPCSGLMNSTVRAYLTERIDPQGRSTQIGYDVLTNIYCGPRYLMRYVTDPDGRTSTYSYNPGNLNQLQQIQDPYGRTASLGYDPTWGLLTSITDAANQTSTFAYETVALPYRSVVNGQCAGPYMGVQNVPYTGWISNLTTPYGSTTFSYFEDQEPDATIE